MNGPGYIRAPVLSLPPSPPCKGTPPTASWVSQPATVERAKQLVEQPVTHTQARPASIP